MPKHVCLQGFMIYQDNTVQKYVTSPIFFCHGTLEKSSSAQKYSVSL